jgi:amino acid transporter
MQQTKDTRQLTWLLAWAVVFCDIGISVYYVPGILYGNVGDNTPFFVLLTTIGFIPLALKYIEISWRNPEGGGVVSITTKALGPMWGCLGGMLITTSYFLTAAISAVSGFHYIGSVVQSIDANIVLFACIGLLALALLNILGIRESATVALVMTIAALIVDIVVIAVILAVLTCPTVASRAKVCAKTESWVSRTSSWVWRGLAGLLGFGKHQPTESEHALSAQAHRQMGNDRCGHHYRDHLAFADDVIDQSAAR